MFLYSLLDVSEQTTNLVKWISIVAIVCLLAVIALIAALQKRKFDAKRLAFAGVCVSMSFTLSFIKVSPVQYGGSITLASLVPILIYAYVYGFADGLLVGLIHGLLNFIEDPYILTPATFLLDYLLAFTGVAFMGLFGKTNRREKAVLPVVLGCVCAFLTRFVFHLASGMIFFLENAVWVEFPAWANANAFIYSFIYQCIYIPADCLIALLVLIALVKTGVLDTLVKVMKGKIKTEN